MKYPWYIKIRAESTKGIVWHQFGPGYLTKTEAILGAIKASHVFKEQFIISLTNIAYEEQNQHYSPQPDRYKEGMQDAAAILRDSTKSLGECFKTLEEEINKL